MLNTNLYKNWITAFSISTATFISFTAMATNSSANDGVYLETTVSSFEDCEALCKADRKCRGAEAMQPDTRYPVMQCKLNDGFGEKSPFPNIAPTPLDINIALADFNTYRASHNLSPVVLNTKLNQASLIHARDLAKHGIIAHEGTDGSHHGDRVQRQGYVFTLAAENVATGQKSWDSAFKAWQDSPGHNKNLLLEDVTDFGIALVYEPTTTYQTYWAMLVAIPMDPKYLPRN